MKPCSRIALSILLLFFALITPGTAATVISLYENAPTPLNHAVHRLSEYTGIPEGRAGGRQSDIQVALNTSPDPKIGSQGYTISTSDDGIRIAGNTAEGAANGIYTLLRTLMIEHRKDPFSRKWSVEEKPQFSVRAMQIAPYRFGASYGFAVLSPDRWTFEEWKEYVDFMRLCNMTTLVMASHRVYDPAYPQSERDKWRYEVWKKVMDYCHQVGIKFHWYMNPNLVTQQAFWDNPDKRAIQDEGAWYGNGLNWSKGKDLILQDQKYTMEYFREMDGLEIIYSDGGGLSFDDATGKNPAAYFADATRSYMDLMRSVGNDGQFVYWNWVLYLWSSAIIPENILQKYPRWRTMQDDVIPLLPKNVAWLDASVLTVAQNWETFLRPRGNPPVREGLLIGKEHGFRPIIDFFWYMNPEMSFNMFPHPFIRRAIQEAQYARDEIGADGTEGYRLAPPCKFIEDYTFFRVSSDPSLTQEQLVNELAGLLVEKPENRQPVKEAINTLEEFWTSRKLADIEKAESLFRQVKQKEKSKNLEYIGNGVTFLTYIVRMAQPGVTPQQKAQLRQELYQTVKPMYIFQGLTADIVWLPEAVRFFNARVDMMVEDYSHWYTGPMQLREVVDRSIYPKAMSQPFRLQWPQASGGKNRQSERRFAKHGACSYRQCLTADSRQFQKVRKTDRPADP